MIKPFLFTPGPTPIPDSVLRALSQPALHHRSDDFKQILGRIQPPLKTLFGTRSDIMILAASGTGGMEATLTSLLSKSDSILVVDAGKFGQRFAQMGKAYELKVDVIKKKWGESASVEDIRKNLKPSHRALCIQHSETSTGALHPIPEIAAFVRKEFPDCLLIVDAITSVGAMEFRMDEWGVDAVVTGSQKALMLPPGLSLVALSSRAESALTQSNLPRFYFDLNRELKNIRQNQTGFTPAISLIVALEKSLEILQLEGLSQVFERHQKLARSTRQAVKALGLELAAAHPSVACTAAFLPSGVDGKKLLKTIKSQTGFHIAGAQDEWEGKVVRFSHLGYYSPFDLLACLAAFGRELERSSFKTSTEKALKVFMDSYPI